MQRHVLKTWPPYFAAVANGSKPFEVRKADRNFAVGDTLELAEFVPCPDCQGAGARRWDPQVRAFMACCVSPHGQYTGARLRVAVTYILEGGCFGIADGFVVLGIRFLGEPAQDRGSE